MKAWRIFIAALCGVLALACGWHWVKLLPVDDPAEMHTLWLAGAVVFTREMQRYLRTVD